MKTKTCTACREVKPVSEFYPKLRQLYGVTSKCKECLKVISGDRYHSILKHKPEFVAHRKAYAAAWHLENHEKMNRKIQERHRVQRETCIRAYGGACACCGESHYEFLAIDHIGGGGRQHRKEAGGKICRWLIRHEFPAGFRVLCHNCNSAIGYFGHCPHEADHTRELMTVFG